MGVVQQAGAAPEGGATRYGPWPPWKALARAAELTVAPTRFAAYDLEDVATRLAPPRRRLTPPPNCSPPVTRALSHARRVTDSSDAPHTVELCRACGGPGLAGDGARCATC